MARADPEEGDPVPALEAKDKQASRDLSHGSRHQYHWRYSRKASWRRRKKSLCRGEGSMGQQDKGDCSSQSEVQPHRSSTDPEQPGQQRWCSKDSPRCRNAQKSRAPGPSFGPTQQSSERQHLPHTEQVSLARIYTAAANPVALLQPTRYPGPLQPKPAKALPVNK